MTRMTTPTTSGGVPILGADVTLDTDVIAIRAIHRPTKKAEDHEFLVLRDPGPGVILPIMRALRDEENARAVAKLIGRAVVDDDGLSEEYEPPTEEDIQAAEAAGDDPPEADPRLDDQAQWSSARRFYWLLDSREHQVSTGLIDEMANLLVRKAMTRGGPVSGEAVPTTAPSSSRRGRTSTSRGSTARRSRTA